MWRDVFLILVIISCPLGATAQNQPALLNKDILLMNRAGLGEQIITEKVRNSVCDFDTSPSALADLKTAGISDSVILEMVRCGSRGIVKTRPTPSETSVVDQAKDVRSYGVSFVKHPYRRWRYSFRSEKYDDVSDYLETDLVNVLTKSGLRGVEMASPDAEHPFLTIELLDIIMRPSHKVHIAVEASLTVTDRNNETRYVKKYHGESKLKGTHQPYYMIQDAVKDMVKNMGDDADLARVLAATIDK